MWAGIFALYVGPLFHRRMRRCLRPIAQLCASCSSDLSILSMSPVGTRDQNNYDIRRQNGSLWCGSVCVVDPLVTTPCLQSSQRTHISRFKWNKLLRRLAGIRLHRSCTRATATCPQHRRVSVCARVRVCMYACVYVRVLLLVQLVLWC